MQRMIVDGVQLSDLPTLLELCCMTPTKKEFVLMEELISRLHKLAQGQ
jgi:hypothetical protein